MQKQWGNEDFLHHYCAKGNPNYNRLRSFIDENKISFTVGLNLVNGRSRDSMKDFKMGLFEFPSSDRIEKININLTRTEQVVSLIIIHKPEMEKYVSSCRFVAALKDVISRQDVDFESFMRNLELRMDLIRPSHSIETYVELLLSIYNFKKHKIKKVKA